MYFSCAIGHNGQQKDIFENEIFSSVSKYLRYCYITGNDNKLVMHVATGNLTNTEKQLYQKYEEVKHIKTENNKV